MISPRALNDNDQSAGSLPTDEPAFIVIGKFRRPHGVRGEILMEIITDFPDRIKSGMKIYLGDACKPEVIQSLRSHKDGLLITLASYHTPEEIGIYRNALVFVPIGDLPNLDEDEYYHHQLLGLSVDDVSGKHFGKIVEILTTGANDVLVVKQSENQEVLIPLVDEFVLEINLKAGLVKVRWLHATTPDTIS